MLKNINFRINAKTDAGTKLFIPLSGTAEAGQEEYIQFVDPNETIVFRPTTGHCPIGEITGKNNIKQ